MEPHADQAVLKAVAQAILAAQSASDAKVVSLTGSQSKTTSSKLPPLPTLSKTCMTSSLVNCQYIFKPVTDLKNCPKTTQLLPAICTSHSSSGSQVTTTAEPKASSSSSPPTPPFESGTCRIHIRELDFGGIFDGKNYQLTTKQFDKFSWDSTQTVGKSDSKLPYDVSVEFKGASPSNKRTWRRGSLRGRDRPPPSGLTDQYNFEGYVYNVNAGATSWSSQDRDDKKLPYCNVGEWDTTSGIYDITPVSTLCSLIA
jgi:hypothetical protein